MLSSSAVNENRQRLKYPKFRVTHLEDVCGPFGMFFPTFVPHVSVFGSREKSWLNCGLCAVHRLGFIPGCSVQITRSVLYELIAVKREDRSPFHFSDQVNLMLRETITSLTVGYPVVLFDISCENKSLFCGLSK